MEGQEQQVQQQQAPIIDMEKLDAMFQERMKEGLKVYGEQQQRAQQEQLQQQQEQERQRVANEAAQKDAFGQVLAPYVMPPLQQVNFKADDTRDFVSFYMENPDALTRKAEIEKTFQDMVRAGQTPRPREDINAWIVGRETLAKSKEDAAQRALQASTVNAGAGGRQELLTKDPLEMTQDERRAFLANLSF